MKGERMDLRLGDCVDVLKTLPDASVDAVVCDPPYFIAFMSKKWDNAESGEAQEELHRAWCIEALRVLKPGGHLLAFGGTRTYHRLVCAVEDAGFEIRDCIMWCYGSGFPKSLDVSKAIDKAEGVEFQKVPASGVGFMGPDRPNGYNPTKNRLIRAGESSEAAKQWEGWGTALKPAFEPVVVGRKPLAGTVAENVVKHGTGALNIAATRIPFASAADEKESKDKNQHEDFGTEPLTGNVTYGDYSMVQPKNYNPPGRWPANLLLSHSPSCVHLDADDDTDLWACVPGCPVRAMDAQSGTSKSGGTPFRRPSGMGYHGAQGQSEVAGTCGDTGGASRYFMRFDPADAPFVYAPKANKKERNAGVEGGNKHPTVKPVAVMAYLCLLVTPPGGVILDPFMGSGSTGVAALREGFRFIGIEREAEYFDIAKHRIEHAEREKS